MDNETENTLQSKELGASENVQSENGEIEVIVVKQKMESFF